MSAIPSRRRLPFAALAVLLLALFQPSPAAAVPWSSFWTWLSAWQGGGWISAIGWSDLGPIIDPLGRSTDRADHGPLIDPDGRNSMAVGQSDLGPLIDPNGRNSVTSDRSDHGPIIDPNGSR